MATKENIYTKTIEYLKENFDRPINIVELGISLNKNRLIHNRPSHHWGLYAKESKSNYWCVEVNPYVGNDLLIKTTNLHKKETNNYDGIQYLSMNSIDFLNIFNKKIDFLYLNSYDNIKYENDVNSAQKAQLNEVIIAADLISENGMILISNIRELFPKIIGKGVNSLPYLISRGFKIVKHENKHVLLKKMVIHKNITPKVSAIMCTYGRFKSVQKSLSMFLDQNYDNKELIIFNTAAKPLVLDKSLKNKNIRVVNRQISSETNNLYTNIGQIRRDSILYMSGSIYICWDDDNYYMPFHISQGIKYLLNSDKLAWKPKKSYFSTDGGKTFKITENQLEASILLWGRIFRKTTFGDSSENEHIPWFSYLNENNQLAKTVVTPFESYAYVLGDNSHKQSKNINDQNNFQDHKAMSTDFGNKPLKYQKVSSIYKRILKSTKNNKTLKTELDRIIN